MKRLFVFVLSFGVTALWPAVHVLASSSTDLLAPLYANAKQIKSGPYSATYFTNDSAASVCAFYKRNGIKFDESGKGGCSVQLLDSVAICHAQDRAHSQAPTDPSKAPRGVSNPPPDTAGITVTAGETPPGRHQQRHDSGRKGLGVSLLEAGSRKAAGKQAKQAYGFAITCPV